MPNIEMIRFVNSGTEATMSALRLARAHTKRDKIIKFDGCYHGHADMLLVQAGSGVATLGLPDSPDVPADTVKDTLVANFNDLESVEALFKKYQYQIAAIIVEPVASNMGVSPPQPRFLEGLRAITSRESSGADACAAVVSMPQPDPETHLRLAHPPLAVGIEPQILVHLLVGVRIGQRGGVHEAAEIGRVSAKSTARAASM